MKVAVVGVTGLVGSKMLQVLAERNFPVSELIPVASENSVGKDILFNNKTWKVVSMQTAIDRAPDLALFSAGGSVSKEFAPKFAAKGTYVVDNSSAWRMEKDIPLVIPEVNAHALQAGSHIIA
ncbi:MAG: aspartate-semialdehyde dehydrogenase, partial [Sphingomonadales bacterium]